MIATRELAVAFGGVRPLDGVTVAFTAPICGLIGPNGAGKTTLFNVFSGFVRARTGSVRGDDQDLLAMSPRQRARWGLRRTFQQEQVIDALTVGENLAVALENTTRERAHRTVEEVLEYVGVDAEPSTKAAHLGARDRRLVEIARTLVGRPRIVLLDEPGAGLDDDETAQLARLIRGLPERFDVQVVLVDHDMELVQATCETLAVLDFGRLIAVGPCGDVLRNDDVRRAYLGVTEDAA